MNTTKPLPVGYSKLILDQHVNYLFKRNSDTANKSEHLFETFKKLKLFYFHVFLILSRI